MPIRFEVLAQTHLPAVQAFNARLAAGGIAREYWIGETPVSESAVSPRQFLALDAGGQVRGGYLLQTRPFQAGGRLVSLGDYQSPVSEGVIHKPYLPVGLLLLRDALARNPLLYTVGMGGLDAPLPRLLRAHGWYLRLVPFLFHVNHPARFLRQIRPLRAGAWRRAGADLLALTGLGYVSLKALQWRPRLRLAASLRADQFQGFGSWADELWAAAGSAHSLCALRAAAVLGALYPPEDRCRFVRVRAGERVVGWAALLVSEMRAHKYFGDLRVGTLLDALALPDFIRPTARAAAAALADLDVDLTVTNQNDERWVAALRASGFLTGPSNYGFALSPAARQLLPHFARDEARIHITRGDGDGRVNL